MCTWACSLFNWLLQICALVEVSFGYIHFCWPNQFVKSFVRFKVTVLYLYRFTEETGKPKQRIVLWDIVRRWSCILLGMSFGILDLSHMTIFWTGVSKITTDKKSQFYLAISTSDVMHIWLGNLCVFYMQFWSLVRSLKWVPEMHYSEILGRCTSKCSSCTLNYFFFAM
jgi:zinc transporter ZupT